MYLSRHFQFFLLPPIDKVRRSIFSSLRERAYHVTSRTTLNHFGPPHPHKNIAALQQSLIHGAFLCLTTFFAAQQCARIFTNDCGAPPRPPPSTTATRSNPTHTPVSAVVLVAAGVPTTCGGSQSHTRRNKRRCSSFARCTPQQEYWNNLCCCRPTLSPVYLPLLVLPSWPTTSRVPHQEGVTLTTTNKHRRGEVSLHSPHPINS